tara:strand:- start:186 stop:515 length:330 start_codon:yes stop_codon:yes gene_type:complete
MKTETIQKNIERALREESLNLSHVRVEKGAIDEAREETITYYTSIGIMPALEPRILKKVIEKVMPSEWCQHEHDCCGGWYQGGFNVVERFANMSDSGNYLITVSWNQNL